MSMEKVDTKKHHDNDDFKAVVLMVHETGIEPVRPHRAQDFKSCASACSATRAYSYVVQVTCKITCKNYINIDIKNCQHFFANFTTIFNYA